LLNSLIPSLPSLLTLLVIGIFFGIILSLAKKKLKVEKDPKIEKVLNLLPGANCGACGQPGCAGYATKIVTEGADPSLCPVADEKNLKEIGNLMGLTLEHNKNPLIARIHCQGGKAETTNKFIYDGPQICKAAHDLADGFKTCQFGCLGLGECVQACPFEAIYMGENQLPIVIPEKCTGCGKCVEVCPRDIISLLPQKIKVYVKCKNTEKAPKMKEGCQVGCIGCRLCVKACEEIQAKVKNPKVKSAIEVENFLAVIDYEHCLNCGKCALACQKQEVIAFKTKRV